MELNEFLESWAGRTLDELVDVAERLQADGDDLDVRMARTRAVAEAKRATRRGGGRRRAGDAAHEATLLAKSACRRTGLVDIDRNAATQIVRAAGDAAQALAAGGPFGPGVEVLLRPFRPGALTG